MNGDWERRYHELLRISEQATPLHVLTGQKPIKGIGEVIVEITFPVMFSEQPTFSFGGALEPGSILTGGNFPQVSAVVSQWDLQAKNSSNIGFYYKGAELAVVVSGNDNQTLWLHWTFIGEAIKDVTKVVS